jgi:hypothetical protein
LGVELTAADLARVEEVLNETSVAGERYPEQAMRSVER